jgi:hypothetical protein
MVAVVPSAPLMIPQLTVGGAAESREMRDACLDVARRLAAVADRWLVLGADPAVDPCADPPGRRTVDGAGYGSFLGFGVDVHVSLRPDPGGWARADLPLPVLIAGWLRGQVAGRVSASAVLVDPMLPTAGCRQVGEELAAGIEPGTAVLVVGDGAATHTEKAPGYLDERAGAFDAEVSRALAVADPAGLLALDATLATELHAIGRAPWQVLAGLAAAGGASWEGEVLYSDAPYGVAYHVASWRRAG